LGPIALLAVFSWRSPGFWPALLLRVERPRVGVRVVGDRCGGRVGRELTIAVVVSILALLVSSGGARLAWYEFAGAAAVFFAAAAGAGSSAGCCDGGAWALSAIRLAETVVGVIWCI